MHTESKYTKWKIIAGYTLIVLLSLLSAILIYKQITRLIVSEENLSNANQKFFIIGNTMTGLYEAEALSSAFVQTGSQIYFQKFMDIMQETGEDIDTLKQLSCEPYQQTRIDSIRVLLEEKIKNLQELVWVKQSFTPEEFYSKAIASIASKDTLQHNPATRERIVTRLDTTYIKTQKVVKRWIFSKIQPDSVPQISVTHHIIIDTLDNHSTQNTDTVVNILKNTWEDVQKQSQDINRKINQKEYALIRQSTHITDQLKRILREYEKEEINNSLYKQKNREHTIATTIRIVAWITVIAILLVIFFTFFIWRDLSRSQRYRRELESANRYAAQLLKSREKMILTVTHDIKSPLSSISGYIELLNNTPVTDRQRYFLKNMQGSSQHILQLINNLLDLSKLENNKMTVEEVVFNPAQLFQEILDNFMPLAANKHLNLDGKFGEGLNSGYKGDALRIRQIITNILSNAVKYTKQGSIRFTATTSTDNKQLILKIQDTGSGMTPEEQKMIFEEFTRLKSHSSIEGTGLGLTITLKLIELLGGRIKLESEPGQGSCFTIFLPLQKVSPTTVAPASPSEAPGSYSVTTAENTSLKILLVDDDLLQLQMAQGLLESKGMYPDVTTHPDEALRLLQVTPYDLVFSDIQMPEMNGFELVKHIRNLSQPFARTLPVIALSADSDKQASDYIAEGFTAYLSKPFTSGDLLRLIATLTGKQPSQNLRSIPAVPPAEPSENKTYTLKNILRFADNDPLTVNKILQSFLTSTEEHLIALQQYIKEKQADKIARLAHKMLPMFRQLEALSIVIRLEKLEHPEQADLSDADITALTTEVINQVKELLKLIQ